MSSPSVLSGIYLAHKPIGLSSFDIVKTFKKVAMESGKKKWPLGHGGTLDPFAKGLLLILSGQATRLMELLHSLPKVYEADIDWGSETDTCDHLGQVIFRGNTENFDEELLDRTLRNFIGCSAQVPPATSAKKIGGEAAYKKAHRGESVVLPPSQVYLHEASWIGHDLPKRSRIKIICRGGFYVRSLARDMGHHLSCGAHLSGLHRTAIGPWFDPGEAYQIHITGSDLLPWCNSRILNEFEADHLAHGRPIEIGEIIPSSYSVPNGFPDTSAPLAAIFESKLVALLREREGRLWTVANLRGGL
ncbi:MAG: tRNA pseudouridine(55) synthase TruB [Holophagaceae bacterium]|nr:tRNA pseudouridine(55) synthase TruB [Holophagaceae bacterium]